MVSCPALDTVAVNTNTWHLIVYSQVFQTVWEVGSVVFCLCWVGFVGISPLPCCAWWHHHDDKGNDWSLKLWEGSGYSILCETCPRTVCVYPHSQHQPQQHDPDLRFSWSRQPVKGFYKLLRHLLVYWPLALNIWLKNSNAFILCLLHARGREKICGVKPPVCNISIPQMCPTMYQLGTIPPSPTALALER